MLLSLNSTSQWINLQVLKLLGVLHHEYLVPSGVHHQYCVLRILRRNITTVVKQIESETRNVTTKFTNNLQIFVSIFQLSFNWAIYFYKVTLTVSIYLFSALQDFIRSLLGLKRTPQFSLMQVTQIGRTGVFSLDPRFNSCVFSSESFHIRKPISLRLVRPTLPSSN